MQHNYRSAAQDSQDNTLIIVYNRLINKKNKIWRTIMEPPLGKFIWRITPCLLGLVILPSTLLAHGIIAKPKPALAPTYITSSETYFNIQQPITPAGHIVEPFLGTSIDVSPYIETVSRISPEEEKFRRSDLDYQLQLGATTTLGKSVAINIDPSTGKMHTELALGNGKDKPYTPRFRLRLRTHEVRLMMKMKF
jgi:hypothetical protein